MRWFLVKLAMNELLRRKTQATLIILGLMISTAVITGSLVVGDSMEYLVYSSTFENLGEVDLVIRSGEFFNYEYYSKLADNSTISTKIDKLAPIILLPCSLESIANKRRENKANLFGFNGQFASFGKFTSASNGEKLSDSKLALGNNEIIINERLANRLELDINDNVRLFINNPSFKLESIYSTQVGFNSISRTLIIKHIVRNDDLGRLQLDGRTSDTSNIYIDINYLQNILKVENKINTILISLKGDEHSGLTHEDSTSKLLGQSLDNIIGYEWLGYELNYTDSQYLRLMNKDIFFDDGINNILSNIKAETNLNFAYSPIMTYFVNSITLIQNINDNNDNNDNPNKYNNIINYSMITGLDIEIDSTFGEFKVISPVSASSTGSDLHIAVDDIILIDTAAERLGARVGDWVTVEYMALDRMYNIYNTTHNFQVKYIISLTGKAKDPLLMPDFPGLQGKLDCVNWDPPFPIDLSRITEEDRQYWFDNRGSPRAYITLSQAQALWSTKLGSYTMIKLNTSNNNELGEIEKLEILKNELEPYLDSAFGYSDAELIIDHVKSDSLATASGMSIFPMMFLAFGSAIILAGLALIVTIFLILADSRKYELGIGRALGLKRAQVVRLFMLEGIIYALFSGIIGILFGLVLGWVLISALNSIWSSAVQGYSIPFFFKPISVVIGFFAGFIITILTLYFTSRHISKLNVISVLRDIPEQKEKVKRGILILGGFLIFIGIICLLLSLANITELGEQSSSYFNLLGPVLILFGVAWMTGHITSKLKIRRYIITILAFIILTYIIIYSISIFSEPNAPIVELFFIVGLLLVLDVIIITVINLDIFTDSLVRIFGLSKSSLPVASYSLKNPTRRLSRTSQVIAIFTLVIFLIAALSINIAIQQRSLNVISIEQRGGYDIIGESAVPIAIDLENSTQTNNNKLNAPVLDNVSITEIMMVGPPGGTCSNMNVRYPPRLLGVGHEFIQENLFRFIEKQSTTNSERSTWLELEKEPEENDGRIPIVVDYNTLIWIYEGALGEIYTVEDEAGNKVELEVIGVIENSVFGGTFIMSQSNLEQLYPNSAEYRYALFKLKPGVKTTPERTAAELEEALNRYGMDAQAIRQLINENLEYERSFMVLFQAFLGLGLIVGIIGLGVVTTRSVQERRFEIGVLRALGFKRRMILKAFLLEPSFIGLLAIILGLAVGIISSYLAFGSWTGNNYEFVLPWLELSILVIVIYIAVLLSAIYPAYRASKLPPNEALQRTE